MSSGADSAGSCSWGAKPDFLTVSEGKKLSEREAASASSVGEGDGIEMSAGIIGDESAGAEGDGTSEDGQTEAVGKEEEGDNLMEMDWITAIFLERRTGLGRPQRPFWGYKREDQREILR